MTGARWSTWFWCVADRPVPSLMSPLSKKKTSRLDALARDVCSQSLKAASYRFP